MLEKLLSLLPIRKIAVGGIVSLLALVAVRLHVSIGPEYLNQAALALVGVVGGFLTKDPRVVKGYASVDAFLEAETAVLKKVIADLEAKGTSAGA